jgi:hypothetical protein
VFNRRRITVALIGLIVLVIAGWLIKNAVAEGSTQLSSDQDHCESRVLEPLSTGSLDATNLGR